MYNLAKKNELIDAFEQLLDEGFNANAENYNIEDAMKAGDVDRVREVVKAIYANAIAAIPVGIAIPKSSLYISPLGEGEITVVTVTISNRVNSLKNFKFIYPATHNNTAAKINDFIKSVFATLLVDDMISANLVEVNEVLSRALQAAGLPYSASVISPLGNEGKKIAYMSDDEIVFVADENAALSLDDILVMHEPDELISEEAIEKANEQLSEEIAKAQTVEELVGIHGGLLVGYVCDISKRIKPMTLIRKVCSKDAFKLRGNKDDIAYFDKDGIFALVARRDGHFETLLSPFSTETLHKADYDVIKALA